MCSILSKASGQVLSACHWIKPRAVARLMLCTAPLQICRGRYGSVGRENWADTENEHLEIIDPPNGRSEIPARNFFMDSRGGCGGGAIAAGTGCGSDNNNVTITNSSFFDNSSSGPGGAVSGSISGSGTIMWIGTAGHGVLMTKEPAGDRPQFVCGEVEAATCK